MTEESHTGMKCHFCKKAHRERNSVHIG